MVRKLKSTCDQASITVIQDRKLSTVVCAREERKRKALKCGVTGYEDASRAIHSEVLLFAPQIELVTPVHLRKKCKSAGGTMRKKAPELIEEAEEDAHRKAREVGESSDSNDDSSGSGDGGGSLDGEDSEEQVEELLAEPNAFIGGVNYEADEADTLQSPLRQCRAAAPPRPPPPSAQAYQEFDVDDALLTTMAMPTPASQPQTVRVGSQWTYISSLNWGVECDEDGGWQFKWGKKTEQRLESYLHYDDEQTLQHRTECRTYYDSVVYRNDTTGQSQHSAA